MKTNGLSAGGVAKIFGVAALAATLAACAKYSYEEKEAYCVFNPDNLSARIVDKKLGRDIVLMNEGKITAPGTVRGIPTLPDASDFRLGQSVQNNYFLVMLDKEACQVYADLGFGVTYKFPLRQMDAPAP